MEIPNVKFEPIIVYSTPLANMDLDLKQKHTYLQCQEKWVQSCSTFIPLVETLISEQLTSCSPAKKARLEAKLRKVKYITFPKRTTIIAVCGGTGEGKSSLINSLLDDNILPTSGLRACTSVAIEIRYHDKPTIKADINFFTPAQWRQEVALLHGDLKDEHGRICINKLTGDRLSSWHKVRAVYQQLANWTDHQWSSISVNGIIALDPSTTSTLSTTKYIECQDSATFQGLIKDYVATEANKPGLWPVVQKVVIFCNAEVLFTGGVLVDLSGEGDSNAARNASMMLVQKVILILLNVLLHILRHYIYLQHVIQDGVGLRYEALNFKHYTSSIDPIIDRLSIMKSTDGNLSNITFIATKTDDMIMSQMINDLNLSNDPAVTELQGKIDLMKLMEVSLGEAYDIARENMFNLDRQLEAGGEANQRLKLALTRREKNARFELEQCRFELKTKHREMFSLVTKRRTEFVSNVIRRDFARDMEEISNDSTSGGQLPVFACSAMEYGRLTQRISNDGKQPNFSRTEDTQIPALREWCKLLTLNNQINDYEDAFSELIGLLELVWDCLLKESKFNIQIEQHDMLNRWKSRHGRDSSHSPGHDEHETPFSSSNICGVASCGCAQDRNCIGPILARRLQEDIVSVVDTLKDHLRTRIEAFTKEANKNAISSSVEAINDITKGISWHTLNALLRRKGSWRDHDLNNLVAQAYLSQVMKNWEKLSRGYEGALKETGSGSLKGRIEYLQRHILRYENPIFNDCADVLMDRMMVITKDIEQTLAQFCQKIAFKIERSITNVWVQELSDEGFYAPKGIHDIEGSIKELRIFIRDLL
ncbi:hypothetical protein ABKN59_005268 [Abortiporus biennis]